MIKKYRKKIFRHPLFLQFASWIAAKYMRFVFYTNRWTFINRAAVEHYWDSKSPIIACFWHNRLGMMKFAWQSDTPFHMLISGHSDGKVIAKGIEYLGINTITGSTNKGAGDAIRQLLRVLQQGHSVGVTPDGPRGPRFSVNQGLINIAKKAKTDILPVSYATSRRIVLPSWDKLIIPLPFGRGVFICGDAIIAESITNEEETKLACEKLRAELINISEKADMICGQSRIPEPMQEQATKAVR